VQGLTAHRLCQSKRAGRRPGAADPEPAGGMMR
jgi:hypothetical protein